MEEKKLLEEILKELKTMSGKLDSIMNGSDLYYVQDEVHTACSKIDDLTKIIQKK